MLWLEVGGEIFREPIAGIKILRVQGSASDVRVDASAITGIAVVLNGFDGYDTLIGGSNADTLNGGSGANTVLGLATEIDTTFALMPDWLDRA